MTPTGPDFLLVGRIGRPHGVHGELDVEVLTDYPERFRPGSSLFIGRPDDTAPRPVVVVSARPHRSRLLVRFDVADDRTVAATLTGLAVLIPTAEAEPLAEDAFYAHELIGLTVVTDSGEELGRVTDLLETGTADVLIVRGPRGDVLLPMIGSVIAAVDLAAGQLTVTPLPGLLD